MAVAQGSMERFCRELPDTVNPMWPLRTLPNTCRATSGSGTDSRPERLHHQSQRQWGMRR